MELQVIQKKFYLLFFFIFSFNYSYAQFIKVDPEYSRLEGVKSEISKMPAYTTQLDFPICSDKVAEVLQNHNTCVQKKIEKCDQLDPKDSVSPLNFLQFQASYERNKDDLRFKTLPINDISGKNNKYPKIVTAFFGMMMASLVTDKDGKALIKKVNNQDVYVRKAVKLCTEKDFPFEQFIAKNKDLIPKVNANIQKIIAQSSEATIDSDSKKIALELSKKYKSIDELSNDFSKMKDIYESQKKAGNFQKQNINYNDVDERTDTEAKAIETCPDCLNQAASNLSKLLPIDFNNEKGKRSIAIGLQQNSFEEFLFEIILRNCEGMLHNSPEFSFFPGKEGASQADVQVKIIEVLNKGYPVGFSGVCVDRKNSADKCGSHSVVITGYQKLCNPNNRCKELYKIHNSWGIEWQQLYTKNGWVDAEIFMNEHVSNVEYENAVKEYQIKKVNDSSLKHPPLPLYKPASLVWLEPSQQSQ